MQLVIAAMAGSAMPLAFAPFSLWPVAILSPAILIYQLPFLTKAKQFFWLGWVYGLGYFGFGVYWIYNSLHVYGHAPPFVAGGLTALMIITLALFIACVLYFYHLLGKRFSQQTMLWALPFMWFSMEWFKGWVLTGFPWLSVGYAHVASPLSGFAPIIGVYGLSSLSILVSVLLVLWLRRKSLIYLVLILPVGLAGYALQQLEWTNVSTQPPLNVSMIQGNIPQEMRWRSSDRQKIIESYWSTTQDYWSSGLIVWPEAAIPGRSEDLQKHVLQPMSLKTRDKNTSLLTGILVSNWMNREYFNSMLLLGTNEGVYHKRHLVPFGEYYPFRELLSFMKSYIKIPMSDMSAGPKQQPLMQVKGNYLGVSICYEDVFSRDINLDLPQANILVNTSNDAWFGDSLAPHQHLEIAQMRSLEVERPMIRSSNTGRSAFIDYKGRVLHATEQFKAQTLTAQVQGREGSTPFLKFARVQPWLAVLILLVMLLALRKPQNT